MYVFAISLVIVIGLSTLGWALCKVLVYLANAVAYYQENNEPYEDK